LNEVDLEQARQTKMSVYDQYRTGQEELAQEQAWQSQEDERERRQELVERHEDPRPTYREYLQKQEQELLARTNARRHQLEIAQAAYDRAVEKLECVRRSLTDGLGAEVN
jgi:hypothetical protein